MNHLTKKNVAIIALILALVCNLQFALVKYQGSYFNLGIPALAQSNGDDGGGDDEDDPEDTSEVVDTRVPTNKTTTCKTICYDSQGFPYNTLYNYGNKCPKKRNGTGCTRTVEPCTQPSCSN